MIKLVNHVFSVVACLSLLLLSSITHATIPSTTPSTIQTERLEQLIDNKKLVFNARIVNELPLITKQKVIIEVEVGTARWFNGNIKIDYLNIPQAVVTPISAGVYKDNREVNGVEWEFQRKLIEIFPLDDGQYIVPPISVSMSVSVSANEVIDGILITEEVAFTVARPEALVSVDDYVVSEQVTLTIDGEFNADEPYQIGQALTQTITVSAQEVPAMLLPKLAITQLPGISVYNKPEQLNSKYNRKIKKTFGIRQQSTTFIFEKPGFYTLPEQQIIWWDTVSKQQKQLLIPQRSWTVLAADGKAIEAGSNQQLWLPSQKQLVKVLLMVMLSLVSWLVYQQKNTLLQLYHRLNQTKTKQYKTTFLRAIKQQHYHQACITLYQLADCPEQSISSIKQRLGANADHTQLLDTLFNLAFAKNASFVKSKNERDFSVADAEKLLKGLQRKRGRLKLFKDFVFDLNLNR